MKDKKILLVEDDPDDELLTIRALKKSDIDIIPQIILMDLKLPKIDGIDVLNKIRKSTKTRCIPVVILSTSNDNSDITDCYACGANSYIRKPVDYLEFTQTIQHLANTG